jgi:gamma-glutamylcyclotransferase (GGCT)/AIG2-like uncharacterized protein YtfP
MSLRLFVYGSLLRGERHHSELEDARFERAATTALGFRLVLHGSYPALSEGDGVVHGEVYHVSEELLVRLDVFEGCPNLYQRGTVLLDDGSVAIAYRISAAAARACSEIEGGDWRSPAAAAARRSG